MAQARQAEEDDDPRSLALGAQAVAQARQLDDEALLHAAIACHAKAITFQGTDPADTLAVLRGYLAELVADRPAVLRIRAEIQHRVAHRLIIGGDSDAALAALQEVSAAAEVLDDNQLRVATQLERSTAHLRSGDFEMAEQLGTMALALAMAHDRPEQQMRVLNIRGNIHLEYANRHHRAGDTEAEIEQFLIARRFYEQALVIEKAHPHRRLRHQVSQNAVLTDIGLGHQDAARARLDKLNQEPGPPASIRRQMQRWRLYGNTYVREDRCAEAIEPLRKGLGLAEQLQELNDQIELLDNLSECFETLGDLGQALQTARAARQRVARRLEGENRRRAQLMELRLQMERTQAEAALAQRHAEELETVNRQLRAAQDEAQAATRAKSEFLANMSHEIRTPMTAILGMTQLALRTGLDERQRGYLGNVERAGKALLHIINDILDFSKIEAGRLDIETLPFELADLLDQLIAVIGLRAEQQGLELLFAVDPALPPTLLGDPLRLGQVLTNLASNAVKFTPQGEVTVHVTLQARSADTVTVRFVVADTGIGITAEQRERLFHAFQQGDSSTARRHGGTGLGLVICQRLVQLMGGTLEMDSEPGRGSRFSFALSFGLPPAAEPQMPISLPSVRLLIADDNHSARQILHEMAQALQMQVDSVSSGADAVAAFTQAERARHPYDLVLLDWRMPGMDGVDCARLLLQQSHPARHPPILMTTAFGREELIAALDQAQVGTGAVLTKPVTPSTLLNAVAGALRRPAITQPQPTRPPHSPQANRSRLAGASLLLVEDNLLNQALAIELLEQAGARVTLANHGREALDLLAAGTAFDLVLMDCQMPVLDGYEATRELRRDPRWARLPVVAMTANAMAGDRDKVLAAGMNDHIAKPIDIDALHATVAHWLDHPPGA